MKCLVKEQTPLNCIRFDGTNLAAIKKFYAKYDEYDGGDFMDWSSLKMYDWFVIEFPIDVTGGRIVKYSEKQWQRKFVRVG